MSQFSKTGAGRDAVRSYLRKLRTIPLLSSSAEVDLGKRMERGEQMVSDAVVGICATLDRVTLDHWVGHGQRAPVAAVRRQRAMGSFPRPMGRWNRAGWR